MCRRTKESETGELGEKSSATRCSASTPEPQRKGLSRQSRTQAWGKAPEGVPAELYGRGWTATEHGLCDTRAMRSRVCRVVNWLLMSGLVMSGAGALTSGCATQQSTAQALTVAGAAAVLVGASLAADNNCSASAEGATGSYCSSGLSKGTRQAGTAVALAGVGVAAAGYALQSKGPDQRSLPAPAPRAPTAPYRLIRTTPAQEDPADPADPTDPSDPSAPDPSDPEDPAFPDPSEPIELKTAPPASAPAAAPAACAAPAPAKR
jgi:hypothetical protein